MVVANNCATIQMEAICVNAELASREGLAAYLDVKVSYFLHNYKFI